MSPRVYRNLDEIFAGDCEGMTPDEVAVAHPQATTLRKMDKIGYRYPRGESYFDLISRIEYSEKYNDENYEYRHVIMPKELAKTLPRSTLMSEQEWRNAGIQMSRGWQHFMIHRPERHIFLFRRPLGTDPLSGKVDPELERSAKDQYMNYLQDNTNLENEMK